MLGFTLFDLPYLKQMQPISFGGLLPSKENMIIWYDANQELYNDGDLVTTITDQSGNSNSASLASTTNPVTFSANILDGKPTFNFTRSLGNTAGFFNVKNFGEITSANTQSAEYIVIIKSYNDPLKDTSHLGPIVFLTKSNTATPTLPYTDGKLYESFATSVGNRAAVKPYSMSNAFRVINMVSTTESMEMIYDGRTLYFDSASTPSTFGLSAPYYLGKPQPTSFAWDGWIAEFMLYAPALTDSNRNQTYTYLQGKYPSLTASYTGSTFNVSPSSSFPSGLTAWWTAISLTALSNGDPVTAWSSSYGNVHLSSSGANTASYRTNVINGMPTVRFTTTTYFTASSRITFPTNDTMTAMAVIRANSDSAITAHDSVHNLQYRVRRGNVNANGFFTNGATERTLTTTRATSSFQTAVWRRALSGSGTSNLMSMPTDKTSGTVNTSVCYISKVGGNPFGIALNGDLAEFIVWNRYLEDWELYELYRHYIYPKYKV